MKPWGTVPNRVKNMRQCTTRKMKLSIVVLSGGTNCLYLVYLKSLEKATLYPGFAVLVSLEIIHLAKLISHHHLCEFSI